MLPLGLGKEVTYLEMILLVGPLMYQLLILSIPLILPWDWVYLFYSLAWHCIKTVGVPFGVPIVNSRYTTNITVESYNLA